MIAELLRAVALASVMLVGIAAQVVDLGFRPRAWQRRLLLAFCKRNVWVVCRQVGKTEIGLRKVVDDALRATQSMSRYAYIAPTRVQAKAVAWDRLKAIVRPVPGAEINEGELSVRFAHNGAKVRLFGADDPDSLRGLTFDGVFVDEVSQHARRVWGEILLPTLAARDGWIVFAGTPQGMNLLSDLYHDHLHDPSWSVAKIDIYESGVFSAEEIAGLRRQCSESQWQQEFEVNFDASSNFLTLNAIAAVTVKGRRVLPPRPGVLEHRGFCDLSGGAPGGEPTALSIAHSERRNGTTVCVIDLVREFKPPFDVTRLCREIAEICRSYGVERLVGDRFGSTYSGKAMRDAGITLWPSERTKSELYSELVPVVHSLRVELPDDSRLRSQLAGLQRRVGRNGREYVDHPPGENDDIANVVAGVVCEVIQPSSYAAGIGHALTDDRKEAAEDAALVGDKRPSWIDFMQKGVRYVPKESNVSRSRGVGRARVMDDVGDQR